MTTVVLQIGNSDDKLIQSEWVQFIAEVRKTIVHDVVTHGGAIHFEGFSLADMRWQNACWVVDLPLAENDALVAAHALWQDLVYLTEFYGQESVGWLDGKTRFVTHGSTYVEATDS